MLPSLHRLTLNECPPCGKAFETWGKALSYTAVKNHKNTKGILNMESDCGICFVPLVEQAELGDETNDIEVLIENSDRCGHAFHRTCLQTFIKAGGRNCPTCRTPIKTVVLRRLGEDPTLVEGEMQRLGQYDTNPDNANFYAPNEGDRARSNNPERDDGAGDPVGEDEDDDNDLFPDRTEYYVNDDDDEFTDLNGEDLRDELLEHIEIYENDDVYAVRDKLRRLRDGQIQLSDLLYDQDFKRWVIYKIRMHDSSYAAAVHMVQILRSIPRTSPHYDEFLQAALEVASRQRGSRTASEKIEEFIREDPVSRA